MMIVKFLRPKFIIAAAILLLLLFLQVVLSVSAETPVEDSTRQSLPAEPTPVPLNDTANLRATSRETQADGLTLTKSARSQTGSPSDVYNGQILTYTLVLTNETTAPLTNILLLDRLPPDALFNIQCSDNCNLISTTQILTDPVAGPLTVTASSEITWLIASLDPGATLTRLVWGAVNCQANGATIQNMVFGNYQQAGESKSTSAQVSVTARTATDSNGVGLTVQQEPVWCSTGMRGVYDLDWGDYDQDGDFDLAVASVGGTRVYQNNANQLNQFWQLDSQTFSVRWVDAVAANGLLELVIAGDGPLPPNSGVSNNYVYKPGTSNFELVSSFNAESTLFRVMPADYNQDGNIDLAGANLVASATNCLVRLYTGNGSGSFAAGACVLQSGDLTSAATPHANALAWADYDNDGDPDLAVGGAANTADSFVQVRRNNGGVFGLGVAIAAADLPVGSGVQATDLAWGDYNSDGYLDLGAGFAKDNGQGQARIYTNNQSGGLSYILPQKTMSTVNQPVALAWGDMDKDGVIDLVVADKQPRVYYGPALTVFKPLLDDSLDGSIWALRLTDYNNDGALDLAFGNRDVPSQLHTTMTPYLAANLQSIHGAANHVAWADTDDDGAPDLLFSAIDGQFGSTLYRNNAGLFSSVQTLDGFGPRSASFGDVNGNTQLDIGLAVNGQNETFLNGGTSATWQSTPNEVTRRVAWADSDGDGDLDLLAANNGVNYVYPNTGSALSSAPVWTSTAALDSRAVAWGDYNRDTYPDFAVANYNGPTQIFCNNRDNTFSLVWSTDNNPATDVAWADYDVDGDLDLAVARYGQADLLYQNPTCQNKTCADTPFQPQATSCGDGETLPVIAPVWTSAAQSKSNSLAWGDWNNDGRPDLAVGNDGQNDYVYANEQSQPDDPHLTLRWLSGDAQPTTAITWVDADGDGDFDLAVSRNGSGASGIYWNTLVTPAHLSDNYAARLPLPQNRVYLSIHKPGDTALGGPFSSAELLAGATTPTVTVKYRLFDPDGSRDQGVTNAAGRVLTMTQVQYSLDGGGWQTATPIVSATSPLSTTRQGMWHTFLWDARTDQAIGDNVRVRIAVMPYLGDAGGLTAQQSGLGFAQTLGAVATSPPFRVRGVSCAWPQGLSIRMSPANAQAGEQIRFEAQLTQASGLLDYIWDFGDGSASLFGPVVHHTFSSNDNYLVKLSVRSAPCPIARELSTVTPVAVGGAYATYLPLVIRGGD